MADDNREDTPHDHEHGHAAVAEGGPDADKLAQSVEIKDVGPCKKHVKVTVERKAIDERFDEKYKEIMQDRSSHVDGFRPGKAPREIVVRRYKESVGEQVRTEVLMASLEQLATENQISPLSPPDINPDKLEIPEQGDFVYEFDVEVRPEFDLPDYKGMKLRRPVKKITPADIQTERKRLLEPYGQLVPKGDNATVDLDDVIIADVAIKDGERALNQLKEIRVRVEKRLVLNDGVAEDFGKKLKGAKAGDTRTVEITLSDHVANDALRGKKVSAGFHINDIKIVRQPELTPDLLERFGVRNEEQLQELVGVVLERRVEYMQRQYARQQILEKISEASQWQLPQDLLARQARRALARKVMEMRSAGMTDDQILARRKLLDQDIIASTAAALKEHFVLQKIAEVEKLEVEEADIDAEIERIAARSDESPRKVRARMEKEDLIEALATDLLERKALEVVLSTAEYEDFELPSVEEDVDQTAAVTEQAIPGQMSDPTAVAPSEEEEKTEE